VFDGRLAESQCPLVVAVNELLCSGSLMSRLDAILGFACIVSMLWLGLWPSVFSILAILVLPAAFIFVSQVFAPSAITSRATRRYLAVSVMVSIGSWLINLVWLAFA
jgi:hypothetical protein